MNSQFFFGNFGAQFSKEWRTTFSGVWALRGWVWASIGTRKFDSEISSLGTIFIHPTGKTG